MIAEAEIRNLAAQFSDAVNYNDLDAFAGLLDEDSVWDIGEPYVSRASGQTEIVALLRRLLEQWAFFVQLTHSEVIEFANTNVATARWSMREVARSSTSTHHPPELKRWPTRLSITTL